MVLMCGTYLINFSEWWCGGVVCSVASFFYDRKIKGILLVTKLVLRDTFFLHILNRWIDD